MPSLSSEFRVSGAGTYPSSSCWHGGTCKVTMRGPMQGARQAGGPPRCRMESTRRRHVCRHTQTLMMTTFRAVIAASRPHPGFCLSWAVQDPGALSPQTAVLQLLFGTLPTGRSCSSAIPTPTVSFENPLAAAGSAKAEQESDGIRQRHAVEGDCNLLAISAFNGASRSDVSGTKHHASPVRASSR